MQPRRCEQHPFYVGKLYQQGRNYTADELRDVTVRLADLDHALKGGSRLAPDLELERALIEITRSRPRSDRERARRPSRRRRRRAHARCVQAHDASPQRRALLRGLPGVSSIGRVSDGADR